MNELGLIVGLSIFAVLAFLLVHLVLFLRHIKKNGQASAAPAPDETAAASAEAVAADVPQVASAGTTAADEPAASTTRRGVRAFMRGNYQEAFKLLQPAAEGGNLKAQQLLAKMYFAGHGVEQDREQYLYWLQRCAENGDKPARAKLKKLRATTA
ncbi:MAG: hypothetical protein Hals2KO_05170 [Halioglobus sp.]